jgi:hypothetical protein
MDGARQRLTGPFLSKQRVPHAHGLEGSRFYVLLNLNTAAEKMNLEIPESLASRRLPKTAPDMAPEATSS